MFPLKEYVKTPPPHKNDKIQVFNHHLGTVRDVAKH